MQKLIKKLRSGYRRLRLGSRYKHQYNCHPAFNLERADTHCTVTWEGRPIASIPFAHSQSGLFSGPCFVIASGPSLADIDLQQIAAYDSISLNCAIKKFTDTGLAPTHCIIVDHRVFNRQWECVCASVRSGANCFFTYEGLSIIAERAPELLTQGHIFLIESATRKYGIPRASAKECLQAFLPDADISLDPALHAYCRSIGFSHNLQKGVFAGKTVATWAVQLGFALGYRSLYILGMDLGGTGKAHFYADQHNPTPDFLPYYEPHIRGCFELARQASEKTGVKLYNLSLQSALPAHIIPKISFAEALQQIDPDASALK